MNKMAVLLRTLMLACLVYVAGYVGYEVFHLSFWMDGTQAVIAGAVSAIVALVVIFATIDYWILRM